MTHPHTQIGVYQSINTATKGASVPGADAPYITVCVLEFGSKLADTLTLTGGYQFNAGTQEVGELDVAITGGTGRFLGATGDVVFQEGSSPTYYGLIRVYVPKL
jgi:hypothetical protein